MKKLIKTLSELANGGIREKCYIKDITFEVPYIKQDFVELGIFIQSHKDTLKNYVIEEVRHNDLLMQYEILVKEKNDERK